ncbi:MAG: hypothetical protein IPK20_21785 [Betaproteobacteria bacterium]|nr:hypothetical protein [Betaproteobacteria bacterium]
MQWPADLQVPEEIQTVAARLSAEPAVLSIVNTRRDAAELVRSLDRGALDAEPTLHLSAAIAASTAQISSARSGIGSMRVARATLARCAWWRRNSWKQ